MLPLNHNTMRKGFTLIEFVIYCGIAITITTALVTAAAHAINEKSRLGQLESISRNARLAEKILTDNIQSAQAITSPTNATSTILILTFATGTTPITFSLDDSSIEIAEGEESPQRITDTEVIATALEFTGITSSSTQGIVRTSFTLSNGGMTKTFNLTNNVYAH